jgi:hypothetical protein
MAWLERRPELGLLCRAARQSGDRITTAVVQAALPGLQDAGANNVIAWCRMLGICDSRGGLSALGEEVADTDEAPVPEQGVYGLWLAQHPLFGNRVLAVERLSSSRDPRFDSIQSLAIEPDRGTVFRSVLDGKERFMVRDLPSNHGQPVGVPGETRATCRLRWTLDFDQARDQWQLDGLIEAPQGSGKYAMKAIQHMPESDTLDLWNLASIWAAGPLSTFGRWQPGERRLAVSFAGLAEGEVESFRKTLLLRRVEVPGNGSYDEVSLEDVPIGPASPQDAQKWATARFDRHLAHQPRFRSRSEVRQEFASLIDGSPLEAHKPILPSHVDMLVLSAKDPERFWSLAAPVDLCPIPVHADELGPFQAGSPAVAPPVEAPTLLRVPYRGGWSMRQFVKRVLAEAIPHKVLLCDRYVRGDENLDTLRILIASLRSISPGVTVEIWTGEEETDMKKIQALTGTAARSYREAFQRSPPHDRYVIVLPAVGRGFGWQMSNSPLHARAETSGAGPEAALRWRDLTASRLVPEELPSRFAQWLGGGLR